MTKELVKKVDSYNKEHMPWWDREEDETCEGVAAKSILEDLDTYYGKDGWDTELRDELRIEAYREALKADPTFFDDADIGYRPDDMVEGWGDIYLGKGIFLKELYGYEDATEDEIKAVFGDVFSLEDDSYYLADCRRDPSTYYKVER